MILTWKIRQWIGLWTMTLLRCPTKSGLSCNGEVPSVPWTPTWHIHRNRLKSVQEEREWCGKISPRHASSIDRFCTEASLRMRQVEVWLAFLIWNDMKIVAGSKDEKHSQNPVIVMKPATMKVGCKLNNVLFLNGYSNSYEPVKKRLIFGLSINSS